MNSQAANTALVCPSHELYRIESKIDALPLGEPRVLFARDVETAKIAVAMMGGRRFCRVEIWIGDAYAPVRL